MTYDKCIIGCGSLAHDSWILAFPARTLPQSCIVGFTRKRSRAGSAETLFRDRRLCPSARLSCVARERES